MNNNNTIWFLQDGAKAHTSREIINLLRQQFLNRVISTNGEFRRSPGSPDLTHSDILFVGLSEGESLY